MRYAAGALLVLAAGVARAEVSVDRPLGGVAPFFQPGPGGPWQRVRNGVSPAAVLNAGGDGRGDGWPVVYFNAPKGQVEVAWSSGGDDREILFSSSDGRSWAPVRNISRDPGADELPAVAPDDRGNRFFTWQRKQNGKSDVFFSALAGNDSCQLYDRNLTPGLPQGRRPSIAVAGGGLVYVAFEEQPEPAALIFIAIDELTVPRDVDGYILCGGEDTIDLARRATVPVKRGHGVGFDHSVEVHAEMGHLWVTWIDTPGSVGFVEIVDSLAGAPGYLAYAPTDTPTATLEEIRAQVLGLPGH